METKIRLTRWEINVAAKSQKVLLVSPTLEEED